MVELSIELCMAHDTHNDSQYIILSLSIEYLGQVRAAAHRHQAGEPLRGDRVGGGCDTRVEAARVPIRAENSTQPMKSASAPFPGGG